MSKKKNKKLTIVLIIVFILGLILGSYAIYKSTYTGKNENKIITASAFNVGAVFRLQLYQLYFYLQFRQQCQ